MPFNTKIKWTIDADNSEILFRIKYVALTGMNDTAGKLHVTKEECTATVDYNLVIFQDKNPKQFWKRKTLSGLLILTSTGRNKLITLRRILNTFDNCGRAAAHYSASGRMKNDFDPDLGSIENEGKTVLNSELIFDGTIRLLQEV